jgi:hypothetical protein
MGWFDLNLFIDLIGSFELTLKGGASGGQRNEKW